MSISKRGAWVGLFLAWLVAAPAPAAERTLVVRTAPNHPMRYWISRPPNWSPRSRWPVIVVIEAANREYEKTARLFATAAGARPFLIVAPLTLTSGGTAQRVQEAFDYPAGAWKLAGEQGNCGFDEQGLRAVLADVQRRDRGEATYFLTGWEAGGHVVWNQVFRHPEQIRAAALAAPNFLGRCLEETSVSHHAARAALPVVVFHGSADSMWTSGRPLHDQWLQARDLGARHGFLGITEKLVPGEGHGPLANAVIDYFASISKR